MADEATPVRPHPSPAAPGRSPAATDGRCEACGSPQARTWATPDGPARLCPSCATLNGVGCP